MIRRVDNPSREADMPRPRPPYLHSEISRHGRRAWYFRKGKGPRVRLPDAYGSDDFWSAYHAAMAGEVAPKKPAGAKSGSLRWLIDKYRAESSHWSQLAQETRQRRERIFLGIMETAGDKPFTAVTRAKIVEGRDRRRATPSAANHFLKAMAGLFAWAFEAGHVATNPCEGVKMLSQKTDGHRPWTEEDIERFEARWPVGTRERLALAILMYTGLRRGDVVKLGRQHVRDGVISLRTEKTNTPVHLPMLPALAEIIDKSPTGDLNFIATKSGRPIGADAFSAMFLCACRAAGVDASPHGLRKVAATRAANAGATVAELEALFGWTGGQMASHYTKEADRARLARQAIAKLAKPER